MVHLMSVDLIFVNSGFYVGEKNEQKVFSLVSMELHNMQYSMFVQFWYLNLLESSLLIEVLPNRTAVYIFQVVWATYPITSAKLPFISAIL